MTAQHLKKLHSLVDTACANQGKGHAMRHTIRSLYVRVQPVQLCLKSLLPRAQAANLRRSVIWWPKGQGRVQ